MQAQRTFEGGPRLADKKRSLVKTFLVVATLVCIGIVLSSSSWKKEDETSTKFPLENMVTSTTTLSGEEKFPDFKTTCSAGEVSRIMTNYLDLMTRYQQTTGSLKRGYGRGLEEWVSPAIRVTDTSDSRAFSEEVGTYDGLPEYRTWIQKMGLFMDKSSSSAHVWRNIKLTWQVGSASSRVAKVTYQDEHMRFGVKSDGDDVPSSRQQDQQEHWEGGSMVGHVIWEPQLYRCVLSRVELRRELTRPVNIQLGNKDLMEILRERAGPVVSADVAESGGGGGLHDDRQLLELHSELVDEMWSAKKADWMEEERKRDEAGMKIRSDTNRKCLDSVGSFLAGFAEHDDNDKVRLHDVNPDGTFQTHQDSLSAVLEGRKMRGKSMVQDGRLVEIGEDKLGLLPTKNEVIVFDSKNGCRIRDIYVAKVQVNEDLEGWFGGLWKKIFPPKLVPAPVVPPLIPNLLPPMESPPFSTMPGNGRNFPRWMAGLRDSTPVFSLSIPGSHDSSATLAIPTAQCQSKDLLTQLMAGIRAVDIRFGLVKGKLWTVHGNAAMAYSVKHQFDLIVTFLHLHPTETVFVNLQEQIGGGDMNVLRQEVGVSRPQFLHSVLSETVTLGALRGKIVLSCSGSFTCPVAPATKGNLVLHAGPWGADVTEPFWANQIQGRLEHSCRHGRTMSGQLEFKSWNGYCYPFIHQNVKCFTYHDPAMFANKLNVMVYYNWFKHRPNPCYVGPNQLDFPGFGAVMGILSRNNMFGPTGVDPAHLP